MCLTKIVSASIQECILMCTATLTAHTCGCIDTAVAQPFTFNSELINKYPYCAAKSECLQIQYVQIIGGWSVLIDPILVLWIPDKSQQDCKLSVLAKMDMDEEQCTCNLPCL
jgi:hypothetical protein